ncbi:MAG TPA: ABC transporter permease subunit [Rectinemataceae bacterium]|nr:ABC transporter permease subunit [Rectinemataceae bacterium]
MSAGERRPRRARHGSGIRAGFSWLWILLGLVYFFLPLIATFLFSLRGKKGVLSFVAYQHVFADPQFLRTFGFSLEMAILTVIVGLALIVPTAIWIYLKLPKAKSVIEFFTLLPFVIPPIILAFGLIRTYSRPPFAIVSSPILLVAGYVIISFPYIYKSVDAGLRAMDLRGLTEAAQSLGAGWLTLFFKVIIPNLKTALLSALFLTLAIVIGELTLAVLLAWPAFGPYMALMGRNLAYEPAALAILSFGMTWGAIGLIQAISRGKPGEGSNLGGTH